MEPHDDENFMTNAQGHLVRLDKIKPEEKLEHDTVLSLFDRAVELNGHLCQFKAAAFADVDAFMQLLAEKYDAKKGGKKGNMTLTSFDGLIKVMISVADFIQFGAQLQVAKSLIDECIKEWGKGGGNENITTLVNHAFRVDKSGQVNTGAILGLRRLDIRDAKWQKAMEAIADATKVVASKQYIRFYRRPSPEANWQAVSLDFAGV